MRELQSITKIFYKDEKSKYCVVTRVTNHPKVSSRFRIHMVNYKVP
jgi:hypothetical protein